MKKRNKHLVPVFAGLAAMANTGCDNKPTASGDEPSATTKTAAPSALPTVLKPADIHRDIPLGGAPMRIPPPERQPLPVKSPAPAKAPTQAPRAPAARAAQSDGAEAAPSPAAAPAPAPAPAKPPGYLHVAHNHPPGEACKPLSDDEIKRAFGDLKR